MKEQVAGFPVGAKLPQLAQSVDEQNAGHIPLVRNRSSRNKGG
jgi:hypothetical protein